MILRYFKIGNLSSCIISDTSLFMGKIHTPSVIYKIFEGEDVKMVKNQYPLRDDCCVPYIGAECPHYNHLDPTL